MLRKSYHISDPISNLESGILFENNANGGNTDFLDLNFTSAGNYRVGFLVDNADFTGISPLSLTLAQTAGGSNSGTTNLTDRNLDGDYYFFDVDAQVDDVYRLSGVGDPSFGGNGIGAITFDTVPTAVPPTAVPFGVSTDLSILILGGLFGASRLRKKLVSK